MRPQRKKKPAAEMVTAAGLEVGVFGSGNEDVYCIPTDFVSGKLINHICALGNDPRFSIPSDDSRYSIRAGIILKEQRATRDRQSKLNDEREQIDK